MKINSFKKLVEGYRDKIHPENPPSVALIMSKIKECSWKTDIDEEN
jgi:hypothetical protein